MSISRRFHRSCLVILMLCCTCSVELLHAQALPPSKPLPPTTQEHREIIRKARAAYYNLKSRGLAGFEANVQPNWKLVLKDQYAANAPGADAAVKILNGIKFTASLDSAGALKVTHEATIAAPNEKAAAGLTQVFGGMEQALTGFFDTWSPFMLFSPFPESNGSFRLQDVDGQYRIFYKEDGVDIVTAMTKDFYISETKTSTAEFTSSLKPKFKKIPQGLILVGYDADYEGTGGTDVTKLSVIVEYQEIDGLQLLTKLNLAGSFQATPGDPKSAFEVELVFNQYKVKTQ